MAENGVDGVFLQRFLGLCDIAGGGNDGNRRIRDQVGDHVQRAAEREGRVYAIMSVFFMTLCSLDVLKRLPLLPTSGMILLACNPNVFKRSLRQTGITCCKKSVC